MRSRSSSDRSRADSPGVRRPSKAGHVYEDIKEAILSGSLEPGSPIDKPALCERLGMSRFPVTTAINRLAHERLVVVEPQHGSFVAKIALSEVSEFMLIRSALEGDIAALAAERKPEGLADELDRSMRYQGAALAARDSAGFYALDVGFHRAICGSLGLGHAAAMLDSLRSHLERIRRILTTPTGRMSATYDEHQAVTAAITSGNPEAARAAMRRHLDQTTAMFEAFAHRNPTLFSDRP